MKSPHQRMVTYSLLRPEEGQQVFVELPLVRGHQAMGCARIDLQGGVLDEPGGEQGRVGNGHDLVIIAMDDQGGDVEALEVFGLVRLGEGLDAVVGRFETDLHRPQPEHVQSALRDLGARPVGPIERDAQILVVLRAIPCDARTETVEGLEGQPARIGGGPQHQRGHRPYQDRLGEAGGAVATDVAGHLATASGMAHQHRVVQIERLEERRQVVGVGVHVVALPGLAGAAMAAPIMGDGAIAVGGHVEHLVVPGVGIERPAVAEDDGLACAPVLEEDRRSICCGDGA